MEGVMMPSTAHGASHADAAEMSDAAIACLDVLRGAAVLVRQNEGALIRLLTAQQSEEVGPQGHRDGRMVVSLVETLSRILDASLIESTQAGSGRAERPRDGDDSAAAEGRRKDDAAEFDRKRPRVENAAEGGHQPQQEQQQQQQRLLLPLTPHHVVPARAGQRPWGSATTVITSTSIVLTSPELLLHVMGYVGGGRGALTSRRLELGKLALVCRAWRTAAQHEGLWEPLAKELIPRLADARSATTTQAELENGGGSYRRYLLEYGCELRGRQVLTRFSWHHNLVLQFDVWHQRSGRYLFSGEGDMFPHTHGNETMLSIGAMIVDEWNSPPFSAASRSGPHRQYDNIHEYLESLRWLKVRVTVHDELTGCRAILYDLCDAVIDEVRASEDDDDDYIVICERQSFTTASFGPASLGGRVSFRVMPNEDQEEHDGVLPDDQKEYIVAFPALTLEADGDWEVGRFVWSALGY